MAISPSVRRPATPLRAAARSFSYWLARVVEFAMIAALIGVTVMIILQVLFRYVLGAPLHYTEEVARYLTIWAALLGASLGVRAGTHFTVTYLTGRLPGWLGRAVTGAGRFAVAIFIGVFLITSLDLARSASVQVSPAARIPLVLVYGAAPVAALLMLTFLLAGLIAGGYERLPSEAEPSEAG
jgi:TRAP-type C4-dicarboxylate transport system permease small subunit